MMVVNLLNEKHVKETLFRKFFPIILFDFINFLPFLL